MSRIRLDRLGWSARLNPLALILVILSPAWGVNSRPHQEGQSSQSPPPPQQSTTQSQDKTNPRRPASDQTINLKTDLVQLRAVVTDKKGNLISDLKKDDFEVREDKAPQEISFFSVESVTAKSPPSAPRSKKGASPVPSLPARTIVLFVDTLHMSLASLVYAKQQLKQFVDGQLTDQDLVAVVATSGNLGVLQQFMKDRRMLKLAIDRTIAYKPIPSLFSPYIAAQALGGDPDAVSVAIQILAMEEGYVPLRTKGQTDDSYMTARANEVLENARNLRRATFQTLKAVADRLADMPGQRIIAFVSDGLSLRDSGTGADTSDMEAAIGRASRSGVLIYSFNTAGLEAPGGATITIGGSGADLETYVNDSRMDEKATLRTLAAETGGESYMNHNFIGGPLRTMLENNSIYYAIAYYPSTDKPLGKPRKIAVHVKDHPEYVVRTQKSYLPEEAKKTEDAVSPEQQLFNAMVSPLPAAGIAVDSSAEFLVNEADDNQVTVQVHIDGKSLNYPLQLEHYQFQCQVAMLVLDGAGKVAASKAQSIESVLTPAQVRIAKANGFRCAERFSLRPGLYQVRVGVSQNGRSEMGTTNSWVEVPDLGKGMLSISSIFLANGGPVARGVAMSTISNASNVSPVGAAKPAPVEKFAVGIPSFSKGEVAHYRFVVYNVPDSQPGEPELKVEVLNGDKPVYSGAEPLSSRIIRKDSKGIEVGGDLRLAMEPGIYTLQIGVKGPKAKKPVYQTTDFEIKP